MAEAEELAYAINPEIDSTRGQYNLAAIYEEYGKNYGILDQTQKALDYLDRAEAARPKTRFWETLLMIARAEALIYNGDVASGKPLAIEAAKITTPNDLIYKSALSGDLEVFWMVCPSRLDFFPLERIPPNSQQR